MKLTQERLKELLDYSPETGEFVWKVTKGSRAIAGEKAGKTPCGIHGYVFIRIDRKAYRAHQLAWLYVHGYFPDTDIDHINRVRHDNRIANLRVVSRSLNALNNGAAGFSRSRDKWRAYITVDGRQRHLGIFETEQEASYAHRRAKEQLTQDSVN